mmetsp:Transcript_30324/g.71485  ORF Transcript_30324/g.71485 Transcript_30324/m.71485 type:complete len:601 (+) Transcript_30324:201-2003(+)
MNRLKSTRLKSNRINPLPPSLVLALVQVDPPDLPVGLGIEPGPGLVAVQIGVAGGDRVVVDVELLVERRAIPGEAVPGDLPAKGQVEDQPVVLEALRGTPAPFPNGKVGVGERPLRRVGPRLGIAIAIDFAIVIAIVISIAIALAVRFPGRQGLPQIVGDAIARKDPGPDVPPRGIPFQRVDASALFVHGFPDGPVPFVDGDASLVVPLVGGVGPAVVGLDSVVKVERAGKGVGNPRGGIPVAGPVVPGHVGVHVASLGRVQGRLGHVLVVDGLDNVDLSVVGPDGLVGAPKGRPDSAAGGHLVDVQEDEPVVEAALALQPDGLPQAIAVFVVGASGLGIEKDGFVVVVVVVVIVIAVVALEPDQVQFLGPLSPDVRVVSRRSDRIGSVVEFVIVEKARAPVGLDEFVGSLALPRGDRISDRCGLFRQRLGHRVDPGPQFLQGNAAAAVQGIADRHGNHRHGEDQHQQQARPSAGPGRNGNVGSQTVLVFVVVLVLVGPGATPRDVGDVGGGLAVGIIVVVVVVVVVGTLAASVVANREVIAVGGSLAAFVVGNEGFVFSGSHGGWNGLLRNGRGMYGCMDVYIMFMFIYRYVAEESMNE